MGCVLCSFVPVSFVPVSFVPADLCMALHLHLLLTKWLSLSSDRCGQIVIVERRQFFNTVVEYFVYNTLVERHDNIKKN
jgi:hypothetical protein